MGGVSCMLLAFSEELPLDDSDLVLILLSWQTSVSVLKKDSLRKSSGFIVLSSSSSSIQILSVLKISLSSNGDCEVKKSKIKIFFITF